jgi:Ca-activated chloride channel homolog
MMGTYGSESEISFTSTNGIAPVLEESSFHIATADLIGGVQIHQSFVNRSEENIEVSYTFPLPAQAVLVDLILKIGGKELKGIVKAKTEAEEEYENAVVDGDLPILLTEVHPGLYSLDIGNLKPGEKIEITIKFLQKLSPVGNQVRIRIPTTLVPRYGTPESAGLEQHNAPETDIFTTRRTRFTGEFHGIFANAKIHSPSHELKLLEKDDFIQFKLKDLYTVMDRDFILLLDLPEKLSCGAMLVEEHDQSLVMASFQPKPFDSDDKHPLNLHIVLDCSASMSSVSIEQSKLALSRILDLLQAGDQFNLTLFGSEHISFSPSLLPATKKNISIFRDKIATINADLGGTEMLAALQSVFTQSHDEGQPFDILLITDGAVYSHDNLLELAKSHPGRCFTVGVGHSAGEIVEELAKATGGVCELVTPDETMAEKVERQFRRIRPPQFSEVRVKWPEKIIRQIPGNLDTIFPGDTVHVFAVYEKPPSGKVVLEIKPKKGRKQVLKAKIKPAPFEKGSLNLHPMAQLAAGEQIKSEKNQAIKANLCEHYGIVSEISSMILVHERSLAERPQSLPALHKVAHMMPAGAHGFGVILESMTMMEDPGDHDAPTFLCRTDSCTPVHTSVSDIFEIDSGSTAKAKRRALLTWIKSLVEDNHELSTIGLQDLQGCGITSKHIRALQNMIDIEGYEESEVVICFLKVLLELSSDLEIPLHAKRLIRKAYRQLSDEHGENPQCYEKIKNCLESYSNP